MPSTPARTVSRVEPHRSRQLISDSRALIASAKAFIAAITPVHSPPELCQDCVRLVPADDPLAACRGGCTGADQP